MTSSKRRLSDHVAHQIERRLLLGEFQPGDALPTETELGETLGVSRTVVREALKILSARDLVEIRQGIGVRVAVPRDTEFARSLVSLLMRSEDVSMGDVMAARAAIEIHVGILAAGAGEDEDFDQIEVALRDFESALTERDWPEVFRAHGTFHFRILAATRMKALITILAPMQDIIALSSLPPRIDIPEYWHLGGHREILDALRNRDVELVRNALERHFRNLEAAEYAEIRKQPFRTAANQLILGPRSHWQLDVEGGVASLQSAPERVNPTTPRDQRQEAEPVR
jgi:GntR family transcriptional regulator, transcriptional repressor for pyruvate dehydrogenase complex